MSLFGRKNLNFDNPPTSYGGKRKNPESLSQRKKPAKPRRFQIAETELEIEHPVLGGGSQLTNSFLSSLGTHSLFPSVASSSSKSSSSSNKSLPPAPTLSKATEAALASSKLDSITSKGPIEASPKLGKRKLKAAKKHAKSLTKGAAWFNMAKTEMTKEKKNDLDVLKLRSAMGGFLHYKRNNLTHTPKYFHVGEIVENKADFYSSRIPKKQRKKTLAQEFAAEFRM